MVVRLLTCNTLLERLPPHLRHMGCTPGPLVEVQEAVVRQRHFAWQQYLLADQPDSGDGVGSCRNFAFADLWSMFSLCHPR
jgi:hypothetical protein